MRETSDEGNPVVLSDPEAPAALAFIEIAKHLGVAVAMANAKAEQESMVQINF